MRRLTETFHCAAVGIANTMSPPDVVPLQNRAVFEFVDWLSSSWMAARFSSSWMAAREPEEYCLWTARSPKPRSSMRQCRYPLALASAPYATVLRLLRFPRCLLVCLCPALPVNFLGQAGPHRAWMIACNIAYVVYSLEISGAVQCRQKFSLRQRLGTVSV